MSKPPIDSVLGELSRLEASNGSKPEFPQQRSFPRYVVRCEADLRPLSQSPIDSEPITAHIRNASRGGIGFVAQQPFETSSVWEVSLIQGGYVVARQPIVVQHCHHVSGNLYMIGGQFIASTTLLLTLGVEPSTLRDNESGDVQAGESDAFLPPSEVS